MYPEPGQRKAKDLLYLAHSLDGSMASIALDDDSQNSTDSSNLNVDEIWKSMNSDLPKTSIAIGVAGGQQSASVQAMLNKISATAKKKEKKAKKKNKKQKAGDASGNNKRKSNKKKLKKALSNAKSMRGTGKYNTGPWCFDLNDDDDDGEDIGMD